MKKILITGSKGYIGSCLFKYLKSKKKYKITGIDKKIGKNSDTIKIDLLNKTKIETISKRKGDVPSLVCKNLRAKNKLKWVPINSNLKKIIKDEINWQRKYK